ncbi:hypothetical protein CPB84DRAFT_1968277 [Gymnopilus junonius]|uniref:Uncharacterized protein n=1 Tax=Gymnopilus junonius TaxID=109634 RepID=A0A9P5N7N9_GYMJU|nr:hypothetical protein CPB84DRAFT_1968277 [Gymnopilus junonius]
MPKCVLDQDIMTPSISGSNSPFWRAYESALKIFLPDVGKDQFIFIRPFTHPWIETKAKSPLPEGIVNYLVHRLADTTLAIDNGAPGSSEGYAEELIMYLNSVDKGLPPSKELLDAIKAAEKRVAETKGKLTQNTENARRRYDRIPPPKANFDDWCVENAPNVPAAREDLNRAKTALEDAETAAYGRSKLVEQHQQYVEEALTTAQKTRYNMLAEEPTDISDAKSDDPTYVPLYSVQGLRTNLNCWIQGNGGEPEAVFTTTIKSLGVDVDWFRLFLISSQEAGPRLINTKGKEEHISLEVTTTGLEKFDISAGEWDFFDVKTQFPKRVPDAPDVLNPKFARPFSFLAGYNIHLKVTIECGFEDKASKEAKNLDQGVKLYGMSVSGGDGPEILFNGGEAKDGESVILTAVVPHPVILAVLAQRL